MAGLPQNVGRGGPLPPGGPARLTPATATALCAFLECCLDSESLPALRRTALGIRAVIPGSVAHFAEVDPARGAMVSVSDACEGGPQVVVERYVRVRDEHPVIVRFAQASGPPEPLAISDIGDERSLRGSTLFSDLYRHPGVIDELVIPVPHPAATVTLCVGRDAWGFTDAEHAAAQAVQRILSMAYASVRERDSGRAVGRVASELLSDAGTEVYALDRFGQARTLDGRAIDVDPAVHDAIAEARPFGDDPAAEADGRPGQQPALVKHGEDASGSPITVHVLQSADGYHVPVVLQRQGVPPRAELLRGRGLTTRQADVMELLLQGKCLGEAALELGISPPNGREARGSSAPDSRCAHARRGDRGAGGGNGRRARVIPSGMAPPGAAVASRSAQPPSGLRACTTPALSGCH